MSAERTDSRAVPSDSSAGADQPGRLAGRVAFVTGAGSGIGRETVLTFIREGARVMAFDMDSAALERLAAEVDSPKAEALATFTGDVSEEAAVSTAVSDATRRFDGLDVLCPFAGVLWRDRDLSVVDTAVEDWDRVIDINLKGVFLTCKHGIPHLKQAGGGSIILIGSICALAGTTPPQDAYNAGKGALVALTRSLAVQFARDRIRANIIHPGIIATAMQAKKLADPDWIKGVEAGIPLGRLGTAADIAGVALFLASDEASYVTGAEIAVDGGYTAQ